jgi:hypothetical protein
MGLGKDLDKTAMKQALLDGGQAVLIRRISGSSPGDPTKGISPTYTFTTHPSRAVVKSVEQADIMYSGGLYQVGDIKVDLVEQLHEVSDRVGTIGDRVVWRDSEYRLVGKTNPTVIGGVTILHSYVLRKVDT